MARIILGAIFIAASMEKIGTPWDFGRAIYVYQFLVGPFAYLISPLAIIIPALELVCGTMLVLNKFVRPAAVVILGLNAIFIIAILSVIARGLDIDCGCGLDTGLLATLVGTQAGWSSIVRDLIFVILNLIVLFAPQSAPEGSR
jgi:uncharacterized membrane protein YphA (DoxX/SURF4 family)